MYGRGNRLLPLEWIDRWAGFREDYYSTTNIMPAHIMKKEMDKRLMEYWLAIRKYCLEGKEKKSGIYKLLQTNIPMRL